MDRVEANTVQCDDNGGCGECACECHTDVVIPGPHIASCKFSDPDYVPPDFGAKVGAALDSLCLCAEIDPSDRPCVVCEARRFNGQA